MWQSVIKLWVSPPKCESTIYLSKEFQQGHGERAWALNVRNMSCRQAHHSRTWNVASQNLAVTLPGSRYVTISHNHQRGHADVAEGTAGVKVTYCGATTEISQWTRSQKNRLHRLGVGILGQCLW